MQCGFSVTALKTEWRKEYFLHEYLEIAALIFFKNAKN